MRNIIQYDSCSEYDSAFFYRLKPHETFSFRNVEFDNYFSTNSKGMRDGDSALTKPDIICLGDSYTLGWGVNQDETYPSILGGLTRKKTLNTAMSSYGTAREIKWLTKLDTSSTQFVVIQYCRNDVGENVVFNENAGVVPISSRETYADARAYYRWGKRYFPGKYAVTLIYSFIKEKIRYLIKGNSKPYYISEDPIAGAVNFVKVLRHIAINPKRVKVILIDLNDHGELNGGFVGAVDSILAAPAYSSIRNSLKIIDLSHMLTPQDYYILDPHLKPSGHLKIARILSQFIKDQ